MSSAHGSVHMPCSRHLKDECRLEHATSPFESSSLDNAVLERAFGRLERAPYTSRSETRSVGLLEQSSGWLERANQSGFHGMLLFRLFIILGCYTLPFTLRLNHVLSLNVISPINRRLIICHYKTFTKYTPSQILV